MKAQELTPATGPQQPGRFEVARLGQEFYERLATFADRFDEPEKRLDGAVQAYNEAAELPVADPIERVPRVLKQVGLMGLPEGATTDDDLTDTS